MCNPAVGEHARDHDNFNSLILKCFSKAYEQDGTPTLELRPVTDIIRHRLVFEDYPVMINNFHEEWNLYSRIAPVDRGTPVRMDPAIPSRRHPWRRHSPQELHSVEDNYLDKDYCYLVADIEVWPEMFFWFSNFLDNE